MTDRGAIKLILFRYLQYGFRDTMRSLWRHKGMVLVSVVTVAIMLIVLGTFHRAIDMTVDPLEAVSVRYFCV